MTAPSPAKAARPVYTNIGKALGTDYFLLKADLTAEERDYLERTRRFVHEEVLPVINGFWERAEVPLDLYRRLARFCTDFRRSLRPDDDAALDAQVPIGVLRIGY